jgi:rhodanese-related sulfurtransferase
MATYGSHVVDNIGGNYNVTVDDEKMAWTSNPPGRKIDKPVTLYCSRGGPVGSGKRFTILPDGSVKPAG